MALSSFRTTCSPSTTLIIRATCDSRFSTALTTIRASLQLSKGTSSSINPVRARTPTFNRNPTAVATCTMADFDNYGGSDEENAEVKRLQDELKKDEDNFEAWEKLIAACQSLEGGLNRNSSPQALATLRETFDRFLNKFPLLFGYWKKYADLEFTIAGPESAEMVYERGCASIAYSVDLWTDYCGFKMETTHDPVLVRDLFERAAAYIGVDFLAHVFWDKYLEYEERQEAHDRVFAILKRVIHIPMHQYARYFDRFHKMSLAQPITELESADVLARYRSEILAEAAQYGVAKSEPEIERDIRAKIDAKFTETFYKTQDEVQKRWTFESEVKRPYFHVKELEHEQLSVWRNYLDFEEKQGDKARVLYLYERCMTVCALYEEFWFRYARWMFLQEGKEEEVRNIYLRAIMFVPISKPGIRMQFAFFEESQGRIDIARDVYAAILEQLPDAIEVIVSWANMERRQAGLDAAIQVFKQHIDLPSIDLFTKAHLVTKWAFMLWKVKGSVDEARTVFTHNVQWYADSREFWQKWLEFELEQPTNSAIEAKHGERVRNVFRDMRNKSRLSADVKTELTQYVINYLQERGDKDAMKEFLKIDADTFGPKSVSSLAKTGGGSAGELDAATRLKAEAHHYIFYQLHAIGPDPTAHGPASFY